MLNRDFKQSGMAEELREY